METICIFGASTTWGAWDLEKGGWTMRLWAYVGNRKGENARWIYNLGIPGATSNMVLTSFENEAKNRWWGEVNQGLIFEIGINDAAFDFDTKESQVSLEKFSDNLEEIIKKAKNLTDNLVFIGLRNCDETKTVPVSWCHLCYTNAKLQEYNRVTKEVCVRNNVFFLEPPHLGEASDFYDGLHPNASGHEKIFQTVKNFLEAKKWI